MERNRDAFGVGLAWAGNQDGNEESARRRRTENHEEAGPCEPTALGVIMKRRG